MKLFKEAQILLKEKSGKKLVPLSVISFLVITALVFFAVFTFCGNICLKQLDEYFGELPGISESCKNELLTRCRFYENDILTRAELGMMLYSEENGLADAERLEQVRRTVSADSVSLLNGQGEVLTTTGSVSPEDIFSACIQTLEPSQSHLEIYAARTEDGEKTGEKDGEGFVRLSIPGNTASSLVFEFNCDMILKLYRDIDDWSDVFRRMFSGRDVAAYAKTGDKLACYPADGLTDDQIRQIHEELTKIFQKSGSIWHTGEGRPVRLITLLGHRYLAASMHYAEEDTDILLTVPFEKAAGNSFYIAAAISIIIGLGIVLFQIYAFRWLQRKKMSGNVHSTTRKQAIRVTRPGILAVLAVTVLFSYMLLQLENRTNAVSTATNKRTDVQYEIDLRKGEENAVRAVFKDSYRTRTQILADFLREHPEYQTREGLEKLNRTAKAEYLMRFDSTGQETLSSNSYTGFTAEKNLGEEYRAVLLGYPSVTTDPAADPYTGQIQLGTAILMTDGDGNADGFLLAVYSAKDLSAELKRTNYAQTVNSYPVRNGHIAAAVNNGNGLFIAHTDPEMIGQKAENVLPHLEPGTNYEGYTDYHGEQVCVSAGTEDGKTLLYIVPERGEAYANPGSALAALAVLLILALVYYPNAAALVSRAMAEADGEIQPCEGTRSPMKVFSEEYSIFLTLFVIFALTASYNGWWTSFDYIFNGQWSKGVHLFSIWAALFILAATLCCLFLIQSVLNYLEGSRSLQGRTVIRLAKSLLSYAASIFLAFNILDRFGVNTTALLASAGIISIAAGMGAQSMAADLLAGFFMMMEGTIHVGDRVSAGSITGCVTDIGIRTTEITDDKGNIVTINNSKISPICNMSRSQALQESKGKPENEAPKAPKPDGDKADRAGGKREAH